MSEAKKQKKSFADRVNAVKESAPLTEKKKPIEKEKKSIGQPKKEEKIKQNIPIVIYVNESQKKQVEQNSINAGYSAKDRAKWLKSIAISNTEPTEEIERLKLLLEEKDNQIKMLKDILTSKQN